MTPLYEKIVVLIENDQQITSSSGLVIKKDMSQTSYTTMLGKVVAVGEGRLLNDGDIRPLTVEVGDTVLFTKMTGESFNDGEHDYIIMSESNVLAIYNKEEV